ncbi:MAG: hypothetical protein LBR41_02360 [Rickettsiales bacterium]|nr:hypothetical protein [Rickettsiales bacterium]
MPDTIDDIIKNLQSEMSDNAAVLRPDQITSPVFVIAPSQIDAISQKLADAVAAGMNMRGFSAKIGRIVAAALPEILSDARKMGGK